MLTLNTALKDIPIAHASVKLANSFQFNRSHDTEFQIDNFMRQVILK